MFAFFIGHMSSTECLQDVSLSHLDPVQSSRTSLIGMLIKSFCSLRAELKLKLDQREDDWWIEKESGISRQSDDEGEG